MEYFLAITGFNQRDVSSARNRIDLIVESSRKKIDMTHFISVPTNSDTIIKNYIEFKNDVLNNIGKNCRNICEEVFKEPIRLHLTVCVLTLLNVKERDEARKHLHECKNLIIE